MTTDTSTPYASDRVFYTGMALAMTVIVFVAFAPSYFLRAPTRPPLPVVLRVHGAAFTCWMVVQLAQASLVAANRRGVHCRHGMAAVVLAAAMVLLGVLAGFDSLRRGLAPGGRDPRAFLIQPIMGMVLFAGFVAAGIRARRSPELHKRLMLLATISLTPAAFGRMVHHSGVPLLVQGGLFSIFGLVLSLVGIAAVYDRMTRGRVHRAYAWGAMVIAGSVPLSLAIGRSAPWLAFASRFQH